MHSVGGKKKHGKNNLIIRTIRVASDLILRVKLNLKNNLCLHRYGLQCVTLLVFSTFFLGLFYRSAGLYHPQRRAILHLKTQKRKVKEKNRKNNRQPFFDVKTLRSQTVRIILLSSAFSAFGIYIPIVHLAQTVEITDKLTDAALPLQTNLGIAWIFGAIAFGVLVIRNNAECRIARQYLCQVSLFMCAVCLLALTKIQANYEGYFIIVWTYGKHSFSFYSILRQLYFHCGFFFSLFFFSIFFLSLLKASFVAVITIH